MFNKQKQQSPNELSPKPFISADSKLLDFNQSVDSYHQQNIREFQNRDQLNLQQSHMNIHSTQGALPSNQTSKHQVTRQSSNISINQLDVQFVEQQLNPQQNSLNLFQWNDSNEYRDCESHNSQNPISRKNSQTEENSNQLEFQSQQLPVNDQTRKKIDTLSKMEQIGQRQQFNNSQDFIYLDQTEQQEQHEQQESQWSNQQHEQHIQQVQKQQQVQKKTRKIKKPMQSNQTLIIKPRKPRKPRIPKQLYCKENQVQMDKSNITEKYQKLLRRRPEILQSTKYNILGYVGYVGYVGYENKIKEHIENDHDFQLPLYVDMENIKQITLQISKVKQIYNEILSFKLNTTQYSNEQKYIIEIMMLIVKIIIYTKIGSNPFIYMLKDIQWLYMMKDDLQYALLKPKVQKALEYIYSFILNNEVGQQSFEKIEWKDLTQNKEYLGYQLEYGKNFFTSLGRNYRQYIDDKKLFDSEDLDKNLYDLGAQQNTYIKKTEFFCEKQDRSGIKYFVVNYYMEFFLKNRYNVTKRIEEIYLDDLINLIISIF